MRKSELKENNKNSLIKYRKKNATKKRKGKNISNKEIIIIKIDGILGQDLNQLKEKEEDQDHQEETIITEIIDTTEKIEIEIIMTIGKDIEGENFDLFAIEIYQICVEILYII